MRAADRLRRRAGLVAMIGAAMAVHVVPVNAESAASNSVLPSNDADMSASASTRNAATRANVFFVAVDEDCTGLAQTISDLLVAHNILTHFEYRRDLTERDLSMKDAASPREQAAVWVLLPKPETVQLVFAEPNLQRFLVRELPLRRGLDDFGRESIAQVVESSLLVLLHGKTGMSRADVQVALGPYLAGNSTRPNTATPAQEQSPPPQPPRSTPTHSALRHRLGASYGLQLTGSALGPQQGPGVVSGLEWDRLSDALFIQAAGEWHFEQAHRTTEFDLTVQSSFAWLLVGWCRPLVGSKFVTSIGSGLEIDRVKTRSTSGSTASPTPFQVNLSPWVRGAVGFELGNSPLVLQFLGTVDASVYRTHYDINRNGVRETMATPWVIRPGVNVTALWR
jgi:hypothetical protein